MNLFALLIPLAVTLLLFGTALGVGRLILRPWRSRFASGVDLLAVAAGLGMAAVSHLILLAGLAGGWRLAGFLPLAALLLAAGVAGWWPCGNQRQFPSASEPDSRWTALEIGGLAVLVFIAAGMALRTVTPPANYDVLEYHLGAVRHWLRAGRIERFPHLFYSALPFEVEMWYAAGTFFEGNPLLPAAPKMINFGVLLCTLSAIYALAGHVCRNRGLRVLACLLFAVHPLSAITSADALNDMGVAWFATLAALAWALWLKDRQPLFRVLWGIFLGLTVCCKYTAVGLLLFPALVLLAPLGLLANRPENDAAAGRPSLRSLRSLPLVWLTVGLVSAAVFAPWALKNTVHYGNPVYPLLSGVFPSETWSPDQTDFYLEAHGRTGPLNAAYWSAFLSNLARLGPWLVAAAAGGAVFARRRAVAGGLAGAVGIGLLVHSLFPGNPARFMLPFLPLAVVATVAFLDRLPAEGNPLRAAAIAPFALWIALGTAAAWVPFHLTGAEPKFAAIGMPVSVQHPAAARLADYLLSSQSRLYLLGQALGRPVVDSQVAINERTAPDASIFLLYEARIACFDRPVAVGSVFDRSPLLERTTGATSAEEVRRRLVESGCDLLYVNEFELRRLAVTYGGAPATDLPDPFVPADFYPPFAQDPRYSARREAIHEFLLRARDRAVFVAPPQGPLRIWIADLREM